MSSFIHLSIITNTVLLLFSCTIRPLPPVYDTGNRQSTDREYVAWWDSHSSIYWRTNKRSLDQKTSPNSSICYTSSNYRQSAPLYLLPQMMCRCRSLEGVWLSTVSQHHLLEIQSAEEIFSSMKQSRRMGLTTCHPEEEFN